MISIITDHRPRYLYRNSNPDCGIQAVVNMMVSIGRIAILSYAATFLLHPPPSWAGIGFDGNSALKSCSREKNCVSSNYLEPPNRYISPLQLVKDRNNAFQTAVRDLREAEYSLAEIIPSKYYIHLTVPGTAPASLDDIEILFSEGGGIVNLRCEARVTLPPPPFCLKKNCINGNMDQRTRLERVTQTLGLPPTDQEQMRSSKWTPIFFNSDRVPGFDDDEGP